MKKNKLQDAALTLQQALVDIRKKIIDISGARKLPFGRDNISLYLYSNGAFVQFNNYTDYDLKVGNLSYIRARTGKYISFKNLDRAVQKLTKCVVVDPQNENLQAELKVAENRVEDLKKKIKDEIG